MKKRLPDHITLEVYQQDWIPGFGAFLSNYRKRPNAPKHIVLNIGSLLTCVLKQDLPKSDLPYMVAETLMHEIMHALEDWSGVEFSEERIEELTEKYRAKYQPPVQKVWKTDKRKRKNKYASI